MSLDPVKGASAPPATRSDDAREGRPGAPNLTFGVVEKLGAAIVAERFSADNPLPVEAELCRLYGVSRPILREAVKMLTAKGLIGSRPRQGTWILQQSRWNLLDPDVLRWLLERRYSPQLLIAFNELRLGIEPAAAALAAERASGEAKALIRRATEHMSEADAGRGDALAADIAFHVAVLNASGNPFFRQMTSFVESALRFSIMRTNAFEGRLASVEAHGLVTEAVCAGRVEPARQAMLDLIESALTSIRKAEAGRSPRS